jgi:hypothetical protein
LVFQPFHKIRGELIFLIQVVIMQQFQQHFILHVHEGLRKRLSTLEDDGCHVLKQRSEKSRSWPYVHLIGLGADMNDGNYVGRFMHAVGIVFYGEN